MKNLALIVLQIWSFALVTLTVGGLIFAIVQVATGNYGGTTAFEF